MGVHPVRYCVVVNSVTLKKLMSFIVSPVRHLLSNGVKEKANHPPLAPPINGGEYLVAKGIICL